MLELPPHYIYVTPVPWHLRGALASHPSEESGLLLVIYLHFHITMKPFLVPPQSVLLFGLYAIVLILSVINLPPKAASANVRT